MYHLEFKSMMYDEEGNFILGEGRAELLKLIDEKGSIKSASSEMEMSYRHAWGVLKKIEDLVDSKVIETKRGGEEKGGSKLTEKGSELLDEYEELKKKQSDEVYKNPALTVDGIITKGERILLIERGKPPFKGKYALPGGFVEYGETVEDAVVREIEEETGQKTGVKRLVGVYSDPERDPRGHTVSVVFELKNTDGEVEGGSDAASASFISLKDLPELAFDHSKIINDFLLSSSDQSVVNSSVPE